MDYFEILKQELRANQVTVKGWSKSSSGRAYPNRMVKIPQPTDADRLFVCFHEIGHIIKGHTSFAAKTQPRFVKEFDCDMYAFQMLEKYQIVPTQEMLWRTEWHVLSRLAMAHNRGLNHSKIPENIKVWLNCIGWPKLSEEWNGKYVYITSPGKGWSKPKAEYANKLSLEEVKMLLGRKGLMIEKSEIDDSTYGNWMVRGNGERYGSEYSNLPEVINHYQLAI